MRGLIRLAGIIDERGFVLKLQKLEGMDDPRVNDAVMTAVSKWTFLPAQRGLELMDVDMVMEIPLALKAQ